MLSYRDSRLTIIILGTFFVLAALYALYEARGQIFGPSIEVSKYERVVLDSFFQITGKALRISKISMNGQDISVTENGDFTENYILAPGYNRIVFDANDAYGRTTQKILEITYKPVLSSTTLPIAPQQTPDNGPLSSSTRGLAPAP